MDLLEKLCLHYKLRPAEMDSGYRVTGSAILVGSGRVTDQCVVPVFDLVLSFNMRIYRGVVSTE